ncbi:hypothetical protein EBH_0080610 [Eimeria brunetti]|uniref:Uncharacterized protein n=1 Tax=Eimeria brunetti TaxID=51314 RepID=U6LZV0_9EIME|nr:hypothetical protein EBH_0080610 [Eimeria brunetti]
MIQTTVSGLANHVGIVVAGIQVVHDSDSDSLRCTMRHVCLAVCADVANSRGVADCICNWVLAYLAMEVPIVLA